MCNTKQGTYEYPVRLEAIMITINIPVVPKHFLGERRRGEAWMDVCFGESMFRFNR